MVNLTPPSTWKKELVLEAYPDVGLIWSTVREKKADGGGRW
jgi:hypothetical protein